MAENHKNRKLSRINARDNEIRISESLKDVKRQNLGIYLDDLFEDFRRIKEKFARDCRMDREEDIIWSRSKE